MSTLHKILKHVLGGAALILVSTSWATAATHLVSEGQSLADAFLLCAPGDTVLVGPGRYLESQLVLPVGVTLRALSPKPAQFPVLSQVGNEAILKCENLGTAARIERIIFEGDMADDSRMPIRGGGIYSSHSAMVLSECVFRDLSATYGGALYITGAVAPSLFNCEFVGNHALASGGAISLVRSRDLLLDHCLFVENTAVAGGSVLNAAFQASARLDHCTLVENGQAGSSDIQVWNSDLVEVNNSILTQSWGRACDGDLSSIPVFSCSDLFGNESGDWIGSLAGQAAQQGNFSLDPLFCNDLGSAGPYGLDEDSPCAPEVNPDCGIVGAMGIGCSNQAGSHGLPDQEIPENSLPVITRLLGNYPNPFNPQTTITFDLNHPEQVSLEVYDLAGRLVRRLHSGGLEAGRHQVLWDGRGSQGRLAAAGVYFYRLSTESVIDTQRMMLVK